MKKKTKTKNIGQSKNLLSELLSNKITHIVSKPGKSVAALPDGEIPLLDPLASAHTPYPVTYDPINYKESFLGIGTTTMIVMETNIPAEWLEDPRLPKPEKTCCEKHPEAPTIKINSVKFHANGKDLNVEISAGHPCGIRRLALFVQDITYGVDAQGKVTKKYSHHTNSNGEFLGSDGPLPKPFPKNTVSTSQFPHEGLWGKSHGLLLVVMANCQHEDGVHFRFSRIYKDFLLI